MNVPFLDLKQTYLELEDEIDTVVKGVMMGGWYILAENVERFEEEFAAYFAVAIAIG